MNFIRYLTALAAAMSLFAACPPAKAGSPMKCIDEKGRVTYTDLRCPDAGSQRDIRIVDNSSDSAEARRAVAADRSAAPPALTKAQSLTRAPSSHDPAALARNCALKKRDYDIAVGSIKKDLVLIDKRYRDAARACGPGVEMHPDHHRLAMNSEIHKKRSSRGIGGRAGDDLPSPVVNE